MTDLVGLVGYATVGKDTAAEGLIKLGWERMAFADPLRDCLLTLNPIVASTPVKVPITKDNPSGVGINRLRLGDCIDAVGWTEAKKLAEVRRLLQVFGTEVVRNNFGRDAWVDLARGRMLPGVSYIFTDCRFDNEVEMIHRAGGIVVKIMRPGVRPVNDHASDAIEHLPVDYTVDNDSTPEALQQYLVELVS